jgi:hypothetical protein
VTDRATAASLATAGATLVLAAATFSSVRSSSRSARIAEAALLIRTRPLLMTSRLDDPAVKLRWMDDHWVKLDGSRAHATVDDGVVYLAVSVRNVAGGVAVLQGWFPHPDESLSDVAFPAPEDFRRQSRDLYIAAGDVGFWQGALREPDDPVRLAMVEVVEARRNFTIDVLYSDHEGGQRAMTRFLVSPAGDDTWLGSVGRQSNIDRDDPR